MSTQNPFFSYCTTYPGGYPLNPGDTTSSTGIELGLNGPTGNPFVITDSGSVVASGVFEPSSPFKQLVNLARGLHRFELRGNASLPATDVWILTVDAAETLKIVSIKGLISGVEIPEGTSTSESLFTMSGRARPNSTIYLRIDGVKQPGLIAVDENGDWTYNTGTQAPGLRTYAIEGNYDKDPGTGAGPISSNRTLSVGSKENIENFTIVDKLGPIREINQKITATYLSAEIKSKTQITGYVAIKNDSYGDFSGNCLVMHTEYFTQPNGEGTFLITLNNPCSKVAFFAKCMLTQQDINGVAATIRYYNQHLLLGQQNLLGEAYPGPYIVRQHEFSSPNITSIEFTVTTRWWTSTSIDDMKLAP
jgi:hypothetical protein